MLPVLDDVSFSVEPGEFVALLGPSGCGKSTLLRLVAGLEPPRSGALREDGDPITGPYPSRVVVFQDPTLFPWRTVWDNVALGLEAQGILKSQRHRVDAALDLVGLSAFRNAYPHQLSGGMAQRVALARALVNDPKMLILDEPLGKLDSLTRITMQAEIVSLWQRKGFTTLLVTHDVGGGAVSGQPRHRVQRPAGAHQGRHRGRSALSAPSRRSISGGIAPANPRAARIGGDMVSAQGGSIREELRWMRFRPSSIAPMCSPPRLRRGAAGHDREASFPFENFDGCPKRDCWR